MSVIADCVLPPVGAECRCWRTAGPAEQSGTRRTTIGGGIRARARDGVSRAGLIDSVDMTQGVAPVAMGRAGSAIHSLHEPA